MYGVMGAVGPIWDGPSAWIAPTDVLGIVILGILLVLHVIIVRLVVRPMHGSDRVVVPRDTPVRRPSESAPMLPADRRPALRPGRRTHDVAHHSGSA